MLSHGKKILSVLIVVMMISTTLCVINYDSEGTGSNDDVTLLTLTDNQVTSDADAKKAFGKDNADYEYKDGTGTLTLKNKINVSGDYQKLIYFSNMDGKIILEKGADVTLSSSYSGNDLCAGLFSNGNLKITGSGSITVKTETNKDRYDDIGICTYSGNIVIDDGAHVSLDMKTKNGMQQRIYGIMGNELSIESAELQISIESTAKNAKAISAGSTVNFDSVNVTIDAKFDNGEFMGISFNSYTSNHQIKDSTIAITATGEKVSAIQNQGPGSSVNISGSEIKSSLNGTWMAIGAYIDKSKITIENSIMDLDVESNTKSMGMLLMTDTNADYSFKNSNMTVNAKGNSNPLAFSSKYDTPTGIKLVESKVSNCNLKKQDGSLIEASGGTYPTEALTYVSFHPSAGDFIRVEYDINGGISATPSQGPVAQNNKFTISDLTPMKEGSTFIGWNDGTKTYLAGEEYTVTDKDVKLTAVWGHTVTYDTDGGSEIQGITIEENKQFNITTEVPTKEGYTFKEWQDDSGVAHKGGDPMTMGTSNITLKAVYDEDPIPSPALDITSIKSGSTVTTSKINIEGKTSSGVEITITVNGKDAGPVEVKTDGSFSKTVNLKEGKNTIVVTATDPASGASTVKNIDVTYEVPAPEDDNNMNYALLAVFFLAIVAVVFVGIYTKE